MGDSVSDPRSIAGACAQTVVLAFTREELAIDVDQGIKGEQMAEIV